METKETKSIIKKPWNPGYFNSDIEFEVPEEKKTEKDLTGIQKYIRNVFLNDKGNFTVFSISHLSNFLGNSYLTSKDLDEVRKELNICKIKLKSLNLSGVQIDNNPESIVEKTYNARGEDRIIANFSHHGNDSDRTWAIINILSEQDELQHINLSGQHFDSKEISAILKKVLEKCPEISELNLSGNNLSIIKKKDIRSISSVSYDAMKILIENIIENHEHIKLRKLWLERCSLGKSRLIRLCKALEKHPFLRLLDIRHNMTWGGDLVEAFLSLSKKNTSLIELAYISATQAMPLKFVNDMLVSNQQKQKDLHNKLLSQGKRQKEALLALRNNKEEWFKLIVGCNYPMKDQEQFSKTEMKFFCARVKANIECAMIQNFLDTIKKEPSSEYFISPFKDDSKFEEDSNSEDSNSIEPEWSEFLKNEKNNILKHIAEIFKVSQSEAEAFFLESDLIKSYENLEQLIKNLKNNWDEGITEIQNILEKSKGNKNQCDKFFDEVMVNRKNKLEELGMEFEKIWRNLYNILDIKFVGKSYCDFVEEIKEPLLLAGIDVNEPIDDFGNTLLHEAFSCNIPWAVKFLLDRGGDPLKNNANGVSVFLNALMKSETINELHDSAHTLIFNYIDKTLEFLWPNTIELTVSKKEADLIEKLKSFFQGYSKKVLERKTQSSLMYFLNFHWLFLENRQKELSQHLMVLRETVDTDNVNNIVNNFKKAIALSNNAKRGLLGKTELNDGAKEIFGQLLTIVENEHKEATLSIDTFSLGRKPTNFPLNSLSRSGKSSISEDRKEAYSHYSKAKTLFKTEDFKGAHQSFNTAKMFFKDALKKEEKANEKEKINKKITKIKEKLMPACESNFRPKKN